MPEGRTFSVTVIATPGGVIVEPVILAIPSRPVAIIWNSQNGTFPEKDYFAWTSDPSSMRPMRMSATQLQLALDPGARAETLGYLVCLTSGCADGAIEAGGNA